MVLAHVCCVVSQRESTLGKICANSVNCPIHNVRQRHDVRHDFGPSRPHPVALALISRLQLEILSERSSLSPGKRLHHQRSSRHAMVPLSDTSPHPGG
jgi:hypothetical protein